MTVRRRLRILGVITIVIAAMVTGIWVIEDITSHRSADRALQRVQVRSALLSDLNATLGYGGMIHSLKNYVLRGRAEYVESFERSHAEAIEALNAYERLPSLDEQERAQLESIRAIIQNYAAAMGTAVSMRDESRSGQAQTAEQIDERIVVDDRPAFHALTTLSEQRDSLVSTVMSDLEGERRMFMATKLLVGIVGAVVFVVLSFRVTKPITHPVLSLGGGDEIPADKAGDLVRQRHELKAILDAVPSPVYIRDDQNVILNLNQAAADAIGLPPEDIIGQKSDDIVPAHCDASSIGGTDAADDARDGGEGSAGGTSAEKRVKRVIRTDEFPLRSPGGEVNRLVAISTDITELRDTERARDLALSRLEQSLRHARQGAWEWDLSNERVTFSDTWYTMLGYEAGEIEPSIGSWESLIHPDDVEYARSELAAHVANENDRYEAQMRMRCKDGSWRWFRAIGESPMRDEKGSARLISGMLIDVDTEQRLAEQLRLRNEELERIVYTASHDLKSPIVTILGFLEHLERFMAQGVQESASRCVAQIRIAAVRMRANVDDLLEVSRMGRMMINPEHVQIEEVINEIVGVLASDIERTGATVRCELDHPTVWCDVRHVYSLLENLMGNALKHARPQEPLVVTVRSRLDDQNMIILEVEDNGRGIPAEYREQVFRIFERLDSSSPGSGIGLAIVRKIILIWEGSIEIQDAEPGARFVIRLPAEARSIRAA